MNGVSRFLSRREKRLGKNGIENVIDFRLLINGSLLAVEMDKEGYLCQISSMAKCADGCV